MTTLTRTQTPEERELAAKNAHLAALTIELAQRELDLAMLQAELRAFEQQYLRVVGVAFAEIDDLEAQIAAAGAIEQQTRIDVTRSDDLKRLYREATKRIHPDLAATDAERAKRNEVMAEVNRAYAEGDEARLRAILIEWDTSPDAVLGDGIGAELVRTLRKIHQVAVRLTAIEDEIATLNGSELSRLKTRVDAGRINGRDVLAEMAEQLTSQVLHLRRRRDELGFTEARS